MAVARAYTVALVGIAGQVVEVEADLSPGLPGFSLVGLPDASVNEARDRVRAALLNAGCHWPQQRVTVGMSPASLPKRGSHFDLAVAVALLVAQGVVPQERVAGLVLMAELGLDGTLRPVRGVLPALLAARHAGRGAAVVAPANHAEAVLVNGMTVAAPRTIGDLIAWLVDGTRPTPVEDLARPNEDPSDMGSVPPQPPDLCDVLGQGRARLAAEVAAAGGHHLLLSGPPGGGKTLIAERIPGLLPPLADDEALEVTALHSLAGALPAGGGLLRGAPWCAPHHSATIPALIGGGSGLPRPGMVSLAHRGVLFLDEAPEFSRAALDALRQPLEAGEVTVARAAGSITLPARVLLVLAMNPCPCARPGAACTCPSLARRRYRARLSGPLLDRIDLQVQTLPVGREQLLGEAPGESTAVVAARVRAARAIAVDRLAGTGWRTNSEVSGPCLRGRFRPRGPAMAPLMRAMDRGAVSARGVDRVLRVAWTLADLSGTTVPGLDEVCGALALRTGEDT